MNVVEVFDGIQRRGRVLCSSVLEKQRSGTCRGNNVDVFKTIGCCSGFLKLVICRRADSSRANEDARLQLERCNHLNINHRAALTFLLISGVLPRRDSGSGAGCPARFEPRVSLRAAGSRLFNAVNAAVVGEVRGGRGALSCE